MSPVKGEKKNTHDSTAPLGRKEFGKPGKIQIMKFHGTNESTILEFWDYDQQKAAESNYKT